jgi:hypothetical protein
LVQLPRAGNRARGNYDIPWGGLCRALDVRFITNELFMKAKANIDKESQKRILELSNEELIKVAFIESPRYREEFVEFAKAEVKKGIS